MATRTPEYFLARYESSGRWWVNKYGEKWRGKPLDEAKAALDAYLKMRVESEVEDEGESLLGGSKAVKRIGATAAAGLVPFGKILVGPASNLTFIKHVLQGFAIEDQAVLDGLHSDLLKISGVYKVPNKVLVKRLELTAEEAFGQGLNHAAEEHAHLLPIIGHIYSVGTGGYRTYAACRKTIIRVAEEAVKVHEALFFPTAVSRGEDSVMDELKRQCEMMAYDNLHRIPDCLACFMGPVSGDRSQLCPHCNSEPGHSPDKLPGGVKPCKTKYHKGFIDKGEGYGHGKHSQHSINWCSLRLVLSVKEEHAWGCIPCFFAYKKHKPKKCQYDQDAICSHCRVLGHHASGCGQRFFNALAALNGTSPNTTNYHPLHINRRLAPSSPRTVLVKRDYYGSPWAIRGTTIQGKVKRYGCFYGTLETAVVLLGPNPRSLDDDDDYVWTWLAWGKWEDRHEDTATMWRRNAEYDQPLYLK